MTQVDFYHLTRADMESVLLMLLKKTLAAGKKALILSPQPAASALDTDLWTREPDSWFAHGLDDAEDNITDVSLLPRIQVLEVQVEITIACLSSFGW